MKANRLLVLSLSAAAWLVWPGALVGRAAASYSVSLSATQTSLEVGDATTLTTTASHDLTGTRYITYLFDQSDPTWYRSCKVQSCDFSVTQATPGSHTYVAYVARERTPPRNPPTGVQATSNTVTVTWTPNTMTVELSATETWLPPGSPSTLTAQASQAMNGRPIAIQIYDLTNGQRIAVCDAGSTCSVTVRESLPSTRTFQAHVAAPSSTPPPNPRASSEVVAVTWSVLPDPTRPPNVGGGPVAGSATFAPPGLLPLGTVNCGFTAMSLDAVSEAAWVNASGSAYAGSLTITAEGDPSCETTSTGGAGMTASISGTNGPMSLSCGQLRGTYTRVTLEVTAILAGDCVLNGVVATRIGFVLKGLLVPSTPGGGLTEPVTDAAFTGAFTLIPA